MQLINWIGLLMTLKLSPKQNEYIREATHRLNFKIGAVRSGKSFVDIVYTIPKRIRTVAGEDGLNVILGVSKETIERNVLQPMRERYTDRLIGSINSRNVARVCGEDVYCLGAEKVSQLGKVQGMSIKYLYGDEIAKWNKDVFMMALSRLDKSYSCMDAACNPESPTHWLKEFLDTKKTDKYVQEYKIFDNPFLPQKFIADLCKEYEGTVYYPRYILGEWTKAEGLIYPMYEDAIIADLPAEFSDYGLSIDYGTQNAFAAILWGENNGTWYAIDEYYYSGRETGIQKTDDEYYADLEKFLEDYFEERPRKIETIIDPSAASFIAVLRKKGGYKVRPADNAVLDGIRETAVCMRRGKIKVYKGLKSWLNEVQGYTWEEGDNEQPIKVNDHCLDGDMLVMTEHGQKPIKELVGTSGKVWSYNVDTKQAELKPYHDCRLTQKDAEIYEIETEDGRKIRCTEEHPILTQRGYVLAKYLNDSDKIIDIMD